MHLKLYSKNSPIPIIADIHFHYKRAIEAADAGAACLRLILKYRFFRKIKVINAAKIIIAQ